MAEFAGSGLAMHATRCGHLDVNVLYVPPTVSLCTYYYSLNKILI